MSYGLWSRQADRLRFKCRRVDFSVVPLSEVPLSGVPPPEVPLPGVSLSGVLSESVLFREGRLRSTFSGGEPSAAYIAPPTSSHIHTHTRVPCRCTPFGVGGGQLTYCMHVFAREGDSFHRNQHHGT